MIKFYVKGFYVMGKALSGELSCMLTGLNSSLCHSYQAENIILMLKGP